MKVAHFAVFAPHACGQYETVKDLILAERLVDIDAQFIDYGWEDKAESRVGLEDGAIVTVGKDWAKSADLIIRHSALPDDIHNMGIPIILALHGRPESTFRLQFDKGQSIMSVIMNKANDKRYAGFISFWKSHIPTWNVLLPGRRVHFVPPPVNMGVYSPDGHAHTFDPHGNPNILIADMWRDDRTPFNLLTCAQVYKEVYAPNAKLHLYGVPSSPFMNQLLSAFKRTGLLGEIYGPMKRIADVYRGADVLLTCNMISTRVLREAYASDLPVVGPWHADPRDPIEFAKKINWMQGIYPKKTVYRQKAIERYNPEKVGSAAKGIFQEVLDETCIGV